MVQPFISGSRYADNFTLRCIHKAFVLQSQRPVGLARDTKINTVLTTHTGKIMRVQHWQRHIEQWVLILAKPLDLTRIQVRAFQQVDNFMCKQCLGSGCSGSPLRVLGLMRFIGLPMASEGAFNTLILKKTCTAMVCDVPSFRSDQSLGEVLHNLHFVHQRLGFWVIMNIVNNIARGALHMSSICIFIEMSSIKN